MFETLLVSRMAGALAAHAATRQSVIAQNVANADTPRYKARDVTSFASMVEEGTALRATRPGHLGTSSGLQSARIVTAGGEPSPNGNTVSLENEMVAAAAVKQDHDMAIGIYRSISGILRGALGRGA